MHRQASSTSSSEYMTSSDLKTPPGSPRPFYSGQPGFASPELVRISASLERTLHIHKGHLHLGLAVETVDKGINGCMVKSIAKPSAVERDGRIRLGDYIVSINNESLRRVTNAQARAIFRRSSLLGSDVSITYIPGEAVEKLQQTEGYTTSPRNSPHKFAQSLKSHDAAVSMATEQSQILAEEATAAVETPAARQASPPEAKSGMVSGQKTLQTDGSTAVGNQMWGPPRIVQLVREPGRSLGISIVGGRVDMFNVSQEHSNAGIFIKQVLADSPAGRNGTLKKGDRILEVSGCDVRNATHDEAVEAIRNSPDLITFVVQSLSYSPCPSDLESSPVKSVQSFKKAALRTESSSPSSPEPSSHQVDIKMSDSVTDSESEDEFGYTKKHIKKKYVDLPGTLHLVDLNRGTSGIGLGLAGNKDRSKMSVFVAGIQPESAAARDGRILVGDELLEISGVNLQGLSHLNASAVIKGVTTPIVKLVVHRREDFLDHMAIKPLSYGGSSQFDVQPIPAVSPRGSADTGTSSSSNSRRESSATSYSHSSSVAPPAASPSSAQSLTPLDVVQVITLQKASCQGLGFGIHEDTKNGRRGIYVNSITQGGIADQDQQLEVGDEILEVEDKSLAGLHYEKAIELLRAAQGSVRLKVRKAGSITNVGLTSNAISDNTQGKMQLLNTLGESSTDHIESSEGGDPKTCPIAPGRHTYIEIEKGKIGLGVGIVGGSDTLLNAILVSEIYDGGAAARDGRLCVGDQVLEVNGEDLTDATHASALQILRQTPSIVKMAVYRDEIRAAEQETLDVFSVELVRRPGKGLGLSIMSKKNAAGVCISDIVKGGTAEADGRLMHGDQILAVNGEDIRTSTQDHVATILKTINGKVHLSLGRLKASSKASSKNNSSYGISLKKSDSSVSSKQKGRHSKNPSEGISQTRSRDVEQDMSGINLSSGFCSDSGDTSPVTPSVSPRIPVLSGKLRVRPGL
ncbi:hypothetical protein BsWGS_19608 [Bradybaena similaris]